ncbi:hypothetical protein OGAPHI_001214 [Ogataea philodendri]|uniref:Uncharacterized protein n=1 Tax=Ogataea philodendri TaxID=1378263 RepID=A0A9P8T9K7_9ASCO|nr:uncharacterized protein OGAPHI_001214 [Ogataea philodendri]KAH3670699.1 hypothetical protein OGAPHI_001214 [Ogataea philodendri]
MSTLYSDRDVDRFLTNFNELHLAREKENRDRLSDLEREVSLKREQYEKSPKKKPLVPKKTKKLGEKVKEELAKKDVEEFLQEMEPQEKEERSQKGPQPIKYEDVVKQKVLTPEWRKTVSSAQSTPKPALKPVSKPPPVVVSPKPVAYTLKPAVKQTLPIPTIAQSTFVAAKPPKSADPPPPFLGVQLSPTRKAAIEPKKEKPEALNQLAFLKPAKPVPQRSTEIPEALSKLSTLAKAKPAPKPVPPKPEALLKFSSLKKVPAESPKPKPSQFLLPPRAKTEPQHPVPRGIALPGLAQPNVFLARASSEPKKPSRDLSSFDTQGQALDHVTKTRAKGPKRRPPKGSSNSNNKTYGAVTSATTKKAPPPIRKSSRQVSNSELFI